MKRFTALWKSLFNFLQYGEKTPTGKGFGTLYGSYLPGLLTMFGVIMYLRLGYITGGLGLSTTLIVIAFSCLIVFITALSISSIATNMHVGAGGTYYIISRSLGLEIGSAVGVPLFIAQTLSISFCTAGFAESVHALFPQISQLTVGVATLCVMLGLVYFSAGIALNAQFFIFLILAVSLISLFLGKKITPEASDQVFESARSLPFWAGFALFFPASTGMEAGVSLSGNLRKPSKSLPRGTLATVITGYIIYSGLAIFLWNCAPRSLLMSDPLVAMSIARFPLLIIAGIWAATLSSVLGCMLSAPRTLQALARDGIFPQSVAKEWGVNKEPRIASLVCFAIAFLGIYFGSIDKIAPIMAMFSLIAYAMLNLATGLEDLLGNPSWRPTFRVPWAVSFAGGALCLMAMFMIDAGSTILAIIAAAAIFLWMRRRKIASDWDDIRHGILLFLSRFAIYRLSQNEAPWRCWRPNFLVFSDAPTQVSNLVNLSAAISKDKGFLTLASVFPHSIADQEKAERWKKIVNTYLREQNIEALVEFSIDDNIASGAKNFFSNYGLGTISPNTVVLGSPTKQENFKDFFLILQMASEAKKNIVVVPDTTAVRPNKKRIDIWWDDSSRNNSELMLVLGHMLSFNKEWKGASVRVNSIASNENGKIQRQKYFQDFIVKSRLSLQSEVHIGGKDPQSLYSSIVASSQEADISLLGLKPPKPGESMESYEQYYLAAIEAAKTIANPAFVIGADHLDFKEIFK